MIFGIIVFLKHFQQIMHNKNSKPAAEPAEPTDVKPVEKTRKTKSKPETVSFSLGARARIKIWQR